MPAAIDITGQKYGRLTALRKVKAHPLCKWEFRCDCGAVVVSLSGPVKLGNKHSCGCLRKEATAARRSKSLIGTRFGRLVVCSQIKDRDRFGKIYWSCLCDCGAETIAQTTLLTLAKKQSCGCLRKEKAYILGKTSGVRKDPAKNTPEYRSARKKLRRMRPEILAAERVSRLLCWALASVGAIKRSATFDMLGYAPSDLVTHLEALFRDGMNWENRAMWHIDHIVPISSAKNIEDVIALNQLSNLRPLWAVENMRKGNRPA